jgi:hypothetical protein
MAGVSVLEWSVAGMNDLAAQMPGTGAWDRPGAAAVIDDMVWQVTLVDATMVRYYPEVYDMVLAGQPAAERRRIEGTLAGLRFVRNRMRRADFAGRPAGGTGPVTDWAWQPVSEPALASLPLVGRSWEMTRYQAYQQFVAGRPVGDVTGRATAFLSQAAAEVPADAGVRAPAGP